MRKVLVCGDRNWTNRESICEHLQTLKAMGYDTVIEGEARGADTIAREEAQQLGMVVEPHPAQWELYGRAAGPIRNKEMLDSGPELVLSFHHDISQSKGTANTVFQAQEMGISTIVVST